MNILLLQPKFLKTEVSYPLGLAYLASILKKTGHRVYGLDCAFHNLSEIINSIIQQKIQLIAISCHSYSYKNAILLSRALKSEFKIPIVFGGPHCTIFPDIVAKEKSVDYMVIGEGEDAIVELVDSLGKDKNIPNTLSFFVKERVRIQKCITSPLIEDISELPFPDRQLFPAKAYFGVNSKNSCYAPIITSRGCTYKCGYCPINALWKNWRGRTAYNVVNEIESVLDQNKIREFHIEDSNFFTDPSRVSQICDEILKRKLDIDWQCTNGIYPENLPPSLLQKMARSGCYRIALGIESFNEDILDRLNRRLNKKKITEIINTSNKYSLEVVGYFILGFPGETSESIESTIRLSRKLGLNFALYSLFQAIPGSEIFEEVKNDHPYEEIIHKNVSFCKVPIEKLRFLRRMAYLSLMLNLKMYPYLLRSLNSMKNINNTVKKAKDFLLG